jgi:4-nitrophenyl phosphatase
MLAPVTIVCDLDGVIWLGDRPIPGSAAAVATLRATGQRFLFVTNNSFATARDVEAKLASFGIPAAGDVVTSGRAAATLVAPGERVLLCAGPGAAEELTAAGAVLIDGAAPDGDEPVDSVVVGFHRSFDYEEMRRAATAVRGGARLLATNDDATYPTPDGPIPGGGAILAGIATAAGRTPLVAGKPYEPMAALVRSLVPDAIADVVMVGDRLDTDGRFAVTIGCRFALVLTGVTTAREVPTDPAPAFVAADLAALVDLLH